MGLSTTHLSLSYGEQPIVHQVDLTVLPQQITALVGPNGCGKSTLLKALVRLLSPQSGHITWQGQDLTVFDAKRMARTFALLPQSQDIPEGVTVREVVGYGRSPYTGFWGQLTPTDQDIVTRMLQVTGTEIYASRQLSELSGGQRQRVWLAMTLAQETDVIFLDEPTTYLDLNHQVELMKLIHQLKESGKTIIMVLHDLNQACRYCDHVLVMKSGHLVAQGSPESIMTPALLKDVFSLDAEVHPDPIAGTPMCVIRDISTPCFD